MGISLASEDVKYRLRLPKQVNKLAENLASLLGEDVELSPDMYKLEMDEAEKKLQVKIKLPKSGEPNADWGWISFSTKPRKEVLEHFQRDDIEVKGPHFSVQSDKGGKKKFFLTFRFTPKTGKEVRVGQPELPVEEKSEGWSTAAKVSIVILGLIFVSLVFNAVPGLPFRIIGSESMEPTLQKGDIVFTKPAEDVNAGDIVTINVSEIYQEKYNYPADIIHRVKEVDGQYVETKGDASGPDPFKSKISNVTGVYTGLKVPWIGYIFLFLQTTWGRTYGIIVISVLVLYSTLPSWLEKRRRKELRVTRALRSAIETRSDMASFSNAINEYAVHLKSHTSAIKNLAKTTKHLDNVVTEMEKRIEDSEES